MQNRTTIWRNFFVIKVLRLTLFFILFFIYVNSKTYDQYVLIFCNIFLEQILKQWTVKNTIKSFNSSEIISVKAYQEEKYIDYDACNLQLNNCLSRIFSCMSISLLISSRILKRNNQSENSGDKWCFSRVGDLAEHKEFDVIFEQVIVNSNLVIQNNGIEKYIKDEINTTNLLFANNSSIINSNYNLSTSLKKTFISEFVVNAFKKVHDHINLKSKNYLLKDKDKKRSTKKVTVIGVGDIMLGTNYPDSSYLPPDDGKNMLLQVREIIRRGDVSFGNLEGVFLTGDGPIKRCFDSKSCYAFKMPDHYVNYLVDAGFNLLSLANNHIWDFGLIGVTNTLKVLNESGILYAGLDLCPYVIFEKNGILFGFAAFAPNEGTININDYCNVRKIISYLDSICDIVIVSFHAGAEGSNYKHITRKEEIFLGENRGNPYEFARVAVDAGADVIFGHGPHVTRAIDIYKDRFIAYSLGNFATYGKFNLTGSNGIAPIIELHLSSEGKFISGKIYSIVQLGAGGPLIDNKNLALKEIQQLTRSDVPECDLKIESDGTITRFNESIEN